MRCPFCGAIEDKVVDTRPSDGDQVIRRRRECIGCGRRFTTYERVDEILPLVVKKDGRREPFDRAKILGGLKKACSKRPVPVEVMEQAADKIERSLEAGDKEIPSSRIGDAVMDALREIDEVAYVRFASVYRSFRDVNELMDTLKTLVDHRGRKAVKKAVFSTADERFMRRALRLAERGRDRAPEPDGRRGHRPQRPGRRPGLPRTGRRPPCGGRRPGQRARRSARDDDVRHARALLPHRPHRPLHRGNPAPRPARVVVGCGDPNPVVDGRGIARLRRAGIRVDTGCLEPEARAAIRAYATWIAEKRPLVTLKVAATLDGYIADAHPRGRRAPAFLTGPEARRVAHELRAAHDAVLVGAGTARADDPRLTVRLPGHDAARGPLRVLLAGRGRLPARLKMLRGRPGGVIRPARDLRRALRALARDHAVQSVLVEGGATVHGAFIEAGLVDRVALFLAPRLIGGGVPIARGADLPLAKALRLGPLSTRTVGQDLLITADVLT